MLGGLVLLAAGCTARGAAVGSTNDALTGVTSEQRGFHFQSYVDVPTTARDNSDIQTAIARQIKSAIGSLQRVDVTFNDLNAENNLDPSTWTRTTLNVVDPPSPMRRYHQIHLRVDYPYNDVAIAI